MPPQTQSPNAPPSVLPADFSGWDASPDKKRETPPATLPANFSQWDAAKPEVQKKSAPPATLPSDHKDWDAKPSADVVMAATPTWGNRILDTLRNTAIGHSIQTVFPNAPEWMKPTTTVGSEESHEEQEQLLKPEYLVQGAFRKHPADQPGLGENIAVGAARVAGGMTTGENLAMMAVPIGEVAGVFGTAGKAIIPRLVSAGFSVQMIKGLYDQAKEYQDAKKRGDTQAAQQILGEMIATAPFLFAAGAHAAGVHLGPREAAARRDASAAVHAEQERQTEIRKVKDTLQKHIEKRTAEIKDEMDAAVREGREARRREEVGKREAVTQTAAQIAKGREETQAARQASAQVPSEEQTSRPVESIIDQSGHVSYPTQFWGETNTFGVGSVGDSHSIYRQTPRGVEWLDRNGNFTETPENLYFNNDPVVSDTIARLSALKTEADNVAAQDTATPEQLKDAENLGEIRRALVDGEIDAKEAQKQAGIAEKISLPDEHLAAREGRLSGPFSEKSASEYASDVESQMRESGASEEEIQATLESLPELARVQVESNLHHVYQPGDYIISKRGVKWTLDAKGLLHSSDGETVPLMKRGTYSNQAMQLAASGRIGYGSKTRLERRADFARNREIKRQIRIRQDEFDREMRIAQQNAGLETIPQEGDVHYEGEREERRKQFIGRPPVAEDIRKAREQRRAAYKASNDPNNIINQLAKQYGVTPDEVMRIGLSERTPTTEAKAASLEVGDRVSDPFRPGRPWIVEERNGQTFLRSGQANPIPFDRLNPSPRVLQILEKGDITHDRDWTDEEKEKVAFEKPYLIHQKMLVDGVRDRMEGKVKDPEPKTQAQAETQAAAAENRKAAAHSQAVKAAEKVANPEVSKNDTPERAAERADELAKDAEKAKKLAKEATAQAAEAKAKAGPKGDFPGRAPISIGLRGNRTTIDQNNRQIRAHYELVPAGAVITSHVWEGDNLVRTPESLYPKPLQPREPNERTILQRRIDAQPFAASDDGRTSGYNFDKYSNKTIDALSGPPLVEPGGRTVSGNGRLQRLLKHYQVLNEIADPEERMAALEGLKSRMAALAKESGIGHYPDDGQFYIVVRMMDEPIQTLEEATKLGLLFNESEADNISDSQKGLVYARSFDQETINKIGRMVEESGGGLAAAMRKNPTFFAQLVADKFDIPTSQQSAWFVPDTDGNDVLTDQGERLFQRAMNGYVIEDPDLLAGIENEVAYRAFTNSVGYVARMKVFPELDLTEKVKEALQAAALTAKAKPDVLTKDVWDAVYQPSQIDLAGMERDLPPEPDRVTEALWRALHSSDAANPRTFSDRMKRWISDESTQTGMFDSTEKALEKPVDKFNRVFASELKETALRRNRGTDKNGTTDGWMLSQNDYDAALRGQEIPDEERVEEKKPEAKAVETPKFGPPPKAPSAEVIADRRLAEDKATQGYVTPQQLKSFLEANPATKDHASELMRTAQLMAEYVYDSDPPVGVDKKQALDWILRERVGRIEAGERSGVRGEYVDPRLEKGIANGILRLHKAADATSFIHEFAHVIFPMLSDEDLKAIDTIGEKKVWDGTAGSLKGETYAALSEKLAHGMERFLRDQNPRDFSAEVGKVLAKVKEVFRKVYMQFRRDPLAPYTLGSDSVELFDRMFHIEGSDVPDVWREEVKKARAEEKKIKRPEDEPHPAVRLARELGGTGLRESIEGRVVDEVGDRVDPKKPVVTIGFPSEEAAMAAVTDKRVKGGQVIEGKDGTWGVKINTTGKVPKTSLFQSLPERNLGLQLEDLEKRLKETPAYKTFERRLLQMQIDKMKSRIRTEAGLEEPEPQRDPELPKQVMQEAKNAKTADRGRKANDGATRIPEPPRVGGIPQPPKLGVSGHAAAERGRATSRGSVPRAPVSLENVRPVNLQPLSGVRGEPVGTTVGEKFDQKDWVDGLKRAGLPESTPPPTYALDPKTAAQLIYPGQKQIVQTVMSALDQGDGAAIITPPGSGKTYTSSAIIKEFLGNKPDAKILVVSKNRSLLKKTKRVAANTFGFDVELDAPEGQPGVYGASYMGLLNDSIYKNSKWDLVVADESGEARRWYDEDTKQGQMLRDVMASSGKGVYLSATPFHCLAPGTSVLMHNGTVKPVEKVRVGDLVMGPDSQPRLVRKLSHGFGQMYEVIPKKGDSYKVNENHILSLRMAGRTIPFQGAYGRRYLGWRTHPPNSVVNVSVLDYLKMSPGGLRSRLLGYRTSVDFPEKSVPIDPYWLGLWLGDGSCRAASICVAEIDPEIQKYIQGYAERLELVATQENCKSPAAKQWRISRGKRGFAKGSNRIVPPNPLTARLRGLGLLGKDSVNKHIPDVYKANSRDVRLRLLAGIIDSDGCCSKMQTSVTTKSKQLADDIAFVARSLGFAAYPKPVFHKLSKLPNVPNWHVGLSGDLELIPVLLPRKKCPKRKVLIPSQNQAMPASRNAKDVLKVGIRVEPCGVGEFYGFELDGDQLFVLGDFTVTHNSPMEYGYLDKLNLWPKGQFDKWIQDNFAHEKIGDKIVARLDPGKQAKLREQLIERGQFVSQAISYDGYNAHFGVVPVTDSMKRGLDRIREGFARARDQFVKMGKQGLAKKTAAFEAVYTKNFLERERLPQAIELAKQARQQGWRVIFFSEHTADDLFRRERVEGEEASTYQQLDDAMGGQLSRIIPPYPSIYDQLFAEFGTQVGDYSGRGNTDAAREEARTKFLKGENSMLYASYAGGGIGVDMHDADYPELNVKGGDKPIVAIYLGPPYSGVLLEQAMGRPWRFGVKSDVHAVFLATDSEPDIRLMQTKVGPRMKALRAAVLGEKDSLANVMSTYTDEEKVRERQDQLAYAEGNEMKVNATQFQVRSKSRNVGIQDWSAITFPSAEEAKNKGMKYGEAVAGGDWSSLYQSKFELRPPDSPEDARAKAEIDRLGNAVASGRAVPAELQNLEPTEVKTAVGLSAATATTETDLPVDRDKTNTARQSMDSQLRSGRPFPYYGLILSQELGMENIARRAGKPEVGKALKLMNRNMRADYDVTRSQYWNLLEDTFKRNGIKTDDKKAVWTIIRVLEGKESSADPKINAVSADLSDMMRMAHQDLSKAGVRVTVGNKKIAYTEFGEDPHYYPHRIDWDHEVVDPVTGEKYKLRDTMKAKFDEQIRKRIIASIPELKSYSYQQVYDYLNRNSPKAPVLSNIHRAREVNFPFVRRDYETLVGYFDQVAEATAQAKNFGPENHKLNEQIRKIDDINGIETLQSMYRSTLEPQNWNDVTAKIYNAAVAYEAASKMTFSAFKVPFHLGLVPLGMEGRALPVAKAIARMALHPREVMENAGYVGVLTRQLSAADIMFGERQASPVRQILRKELFEASYKMVRALSGESARVYLDQYAIRDLKRGGTAGQNTRRLLQETFLIGDGAIDEAVARGRFSPEDIGRAQTAFANLTTFSDDPLQMPQLARAEIAKGESRPMIGLKRAVRLTYALQSFSLKATSLLREKLYDEVVVHKNYRPLAYALVASPIIGQMLQATGAGSKHIIHKGLAGLTGHKAEKDSWDTYIENLKQTFGNPDAVNLLKFIVDGYTLGYGWDMVRTVADPFLDLAAGNLKKSGQEFKYMGADIVSHLVGPFFSDIFATAEEIGRLGQIEAGKNHPLQKPQKVRQSVGKYIEGQVPALKEFPPFESAFGIKPPPR